MQYFNYIAYGNDEYVTEDIFEYEMSRGRMFEYTPVDMEKRLENLRSEAIDFIDKLPTFVCSEIGGRSRKQMKIRFGTISSTRLEDQEVATTFNPIIEFGEVTFPDLDEARKVFGAEGFQLHRTHWAVRPGDVGEILRALGALRPELAGEVDTYLHPAGDAGDDVQPPDGDKNVIDTADSVEKLLELLYGLSGPGRENFFRGHEDEKFQLTPSLLRKWDSGGWKHMPMEDRLCNELLIAHYDEFQADQYCFDRLVRMQHYGLPTRLLDISGNPLVALFFACSGSKASMEIPGELVIFSIAEDKIKYYDSDTVSCLSNMSKLTIEQKDAIDLKADMTEFNKQVPIGKLFHYVKSEKGSFEPRILPSDLGSVLCVKAKRTNSRIKSQSGAFLLFGHQARLSEAGADGIQISRIKIVNKQAILDQLDSININATTVYPSIDQTAVHLRARYEIAEA